MVEPPVVVLAHPLTQQAELPVSPLELALGAVYVLLLVGALAGRRFRNQDPESAPATAASPADHDAPSGALGTTVFWAARTVGLGLFVLAIVAGSLGDPNELNNVAPALTIGAGWPLLTLACVLVGRIWWWVNPLDTLARPLSALGAGDGSALDADGQWMSVWWALPAAAAWMVYLTVWPGALTPRSIGTALIAYTLVTLAGCLALGRRTWLWRGEFFTVFFELLGETRNPASAKPPAGSPALLGVVCGAALFGLLRDSDLGKFFAYGPSAELYTRIAVVAFMLVAAVAAERGARRSVPGSVAVGLAPMTAAFVVALALARNRFTTSLQLLRITAPDPMGTGLDDFGAHLAGLDPRPFGLVGLVWLQVGLLVVGSAAGVWLARHFTQSHAPFVRKARFTPRRTSGIVFGLLGTLLAVGVAAAAAI